jgi:two-component system, chemotaxis family, protein-glutamate methylesterase/glutaminase
VGTARGVPLLPRSRPLDVGARAARPRGTPEIVVVGAPVAAAQTAAMFLVGLPEGFELPIVLVLSGDAEDHDDLCVRLQAHCALPVRQIDDKDPILSGRIHLAPADYHVLVERRSFVLSTEGPVRGARPSIDVLLESASDVFGDGVVCVLLGTFAAPQTAVDGADGAACVRARGGLVIVQNPATAATGAPAEAPPIPTATMLHLSEIAPFVSRLGDLELT